MRQHVIRQPPDLVERREVGQIEPGAGHLSERRVAALA